MTVTGSFASSFENEWLGCSGGYVPLDVQYILPYRQAQDTICFRHIKCEYCGAANKQEDLECRKCGAPVW